MIKTLLFSTLFPNSVQPQHGVFVENRLRHLLETGEITTKVIAPVPWFPFKAPIFGKYATFSSVPDEEQRNSVDVLHPRYLLLPKLGMNNAPESIFRVALPRAKALIKSGFDFDLIDAHYFYPDGVAAVMLGEALGKPVIITARGTDLNLIPKYEIPRQKILWAANKADALITVCQALKDVLLEMGVPDNKITVLRNGVDLGTFSPPLNREELRNKLDINGKTLLSVGHLVERKGHHLIVEAMCLLPEYKLLIAGDGEERSNLVALINKLKLNERVTLLGAVPHESLKEYYGASDALVLASSREGWANVLLESMACGTPVVATRIWGTPEVVTIPASGVLVEERTPDSLACSIKSLFSRHVNRDETRGYAEQFGWEDTTQGQLKLFEQVVGNA
ncbi:MAG: glycosyltransferase family 4 protein [Gammaproteobacteria bacterium]|nr:glycosyltransferase family 4 protein [Gammaproteobacteria bacterium]